jgi:APA family basic amino acid/polyamine antiporter
MAAAILPVLFATGGWQQGSFLAGAARRPLRDVPLGILAGVAVVVVTYLSINLAYLHLLGFAGAREHSAIGAAAAKVVLDEAGGRVFAAMVVVSAAGIMNTICMAPPYVLYAMAQDGVFPRAFGRLDARGTPVLGVLGQGLWAVVLLLGVHLFTRTTTGDAAADRNATTSRLDFLCTGVVFVDWVFFTLCGLALLRLRHIGRTTIRIPGGGIVAALFAAAACLVVIGAITQDPVNTRASAAGAAIVALGLPVFWFFLRRRPGAVEA